MIGHLRLPVQARQAGKNPPRRPQPSPAQPAPAWLCPVWPCWLAGQHCVCQLFRLALGSFLPFLGDSCFPASPALISRSATLAAFCCLTSPLKRNPVIIAILNIANPHALFSRTTTPTTTHELALALPLAHLRLSVSSPASPSRPTVVHRRPLHRSIAVFASPFLHRQIIHRPFNCPSSTVSTHRIESKTSLLAIVTDGYCLGGLIFDQSAHCPDTPLSLEPLAATS